MKNENLDSVDKALEIVLRMYRERYPKNVIATEIEKRACISVENQRDAEIVHIEYWLRDRKDPFCFFQARVDRKTWEASIITAEKPDSISLSDLAEFRAEDAQIT